ncbi:hypothetical protein [Gilvimarinus xylanilyticus]|uniref:Uncharacterized protein n=1 Tax=Gilvimarinus xylanilyticus TaxID=2944139 RepID=A0A9X2HVN1_9GAMM|nr:hypothetical protein [Gilvimarinus xylanilyticus]MCP8898504.1 hypothetical protein [Gilvimarinus xylanilyticus]
MKSVLILLSLLASCAVIILWMRSRHSQARIYPALALIALGVGIAALIPYFGSPRAVFIALGATSLAGCIIVIAKPLISRNAP